MRIIIQILIIFLVTACSFGQSNDQENSRLTRIIKENSYFGIRDTAARALHKKGLNAIRDKNILLAKDYFVKADKLEPKNVIIYNSLGLAELELHHFDQSVSYFQEAFKIDSLFLNTYVNYGYLLNSNKQYASALEVFVKGLNVAKTIEEKGYLEFNTAISLFRLNKCSQAINLADSAILHLNSDDMTRKINMFKNDVSNNCINL